MSVGDALGVPSVSSEGDNLNEARALDSALAAARRLNELAASGKKEKGQERAARRSSLALQKQTEALFNFNGESESDGGIDMKEEDAVTLDDVAKAESSDSESSGPPGLCSVSNTSSDTYKSTRGMSEDDYEVKEEKEEESDVEACAVPVNEGGPIRGEAEQPTSPPSRARESTPPPRPSLHPPSPRALSKEAATVHGSAGSLLNPIPLLSTTTSDSDQPGATNPATPMVSSVIETPDRLPEVPNTADKAFIKRSDESDSLVGPSHDSDDPDYELTPTSVEETSEVSQPSTGEGGANPTPKQATATGVGTENSPTPEAAGEAAAAVGSKTAAATGAEATPRKGDATEGKGEKVPVAREHLRVEEEIERRAAELYRKHLASVTSQTRQRIKKSESRAVREANPPRDPDTDPIAEFREKRRLELAKATEGAVGGPEAAQQLRKKEKKARKRASRKKRHAAEREQRAAEEAKFERQLEASLEAVAESDASKPEADEVPKDKKRSKRQRAERGAGRPSRKQTKKARRAARRKRRKGKRKDKRERRRQKRRERRERKKKRRRRRRDPESDPSSSDSSSSSESSETSESTSTTESSTSSSSSEDSSDLANRESGSGDESS